MTNKNQSGEAKKSDTFHITKGQMEKTASYHEKYKKIFIALLASVLQHRTKRYCPNDAFNSLAEEGNMIHYQMYQYEEYEEYEENEHKIDSQDNEPDPSFDPETCALGYFFDCLAQKISITHHAKDVMNSIYRDTDEETVWEMLGDMLYRVGYNIRNRDTKYAKKANNLQERQNAKLKEKVGELIKARIAEAPRCIDDPKKLLRSVLVDVVSGSGAAETRTGWIRNWYAKYREEKIILAFCMAQLREDHEYTQNLTEHCAKLLPLHRDSRRIHAQKKVTKNSKYRQFFKKEKNSLKYRLSFIGRLKRRVWPHQSYDEIIRGYLRS